MKKTKIRVNISVDKELLEKTKTKLHLFGGKLSTLFNVYLRDFVDTMDQDFSANQKEMASKVQELEDRISKLEKQKR